MARPLQWKRCVFMHRRCGVYTIGVSPCWVGKGHTMMSSRSLRTHSVWNSDTRLQISLKTCTIVWNSDTQKWGRSFNKTMFKRASLKHSFIKRTTPFLSSVESTELKFATAPGRPNQYFHTWNIDLDRMFRIKTRLSYVEAQFLSNV